jgi:hypothetical protein
MTVTIDEQMEKLQQAVLSRPKEQQLFSMIRDILKDAIDARSPRNRPPGKAGLRAEKGYYRLLYLQGDFHAMIGTPEDTEHRGGAGHWAAVAAVVRQLKDIPELQSEILSGIEVALAGLADPPPEQ